MRVRAGRGREAGLELLAEAVKTLERSQSPLELARARADYGAALRRAGRRVQARTELARALDLAHGLGARRIAAQARTELTAAGAKPRREAITGRDTLTAGELRDTRLTAEAMTNRKIAQALFTTTKTAKGLSHVYRKLEITRRGQLANALTGFLDDDGEHLSATATISRFPKTSRAIRQDPAGRRATRPAGRDSLLTKIATPKRSVRDLSFSSMKGVLVMQVRIGLIATVVAAVFGSLCSTAFAAVTPGWECVPTTAGQAVTSGGTGASPSCGSSSTPVLAPTYVSAGVGNTATAEFSGVNVQIVNGSGSESDTTNHEGNLVIGYDPSPGTQTGSHNLLLGTGGASATSYGGINAGSNNTISGPGASVVGGSTNSASGSGATVSGGEANTARGFDSSVSGGDGNIIPSGSSDSSVTGGQSNTASGNISSVSGGVGNTASGGYSSVSGGRQNTASGNYSWVTGGNANAATGDYSSISGGTSNTTSGPGSSASGGWQNTASGMSSWVGGGHSNHTVGYAGSISGGASNLVAGGSFGSILGGFGNTVSSNCGTFPATGQSC